MLRLATYNVENLFDRPAILNLKDSQQTNVLLGKVSELQSLIDKPVYSDSDKAAIFSLYFELNRYIEIQEDVGKLFTRRGMALDRVSADGRGDWYGGIQFRRAQFGDQQRINTATMIKKVNADIQCLIEVEGNQALDDFNSKLMARRFQQHLSIDSPIDPRGIDIGLYLRKAKMGRIRTNAFDKKGARSIWSRDCLEVECLLPSGRSLFLLINHFKSKFGGDTPDALAKRKGQSERVLQILAERYDPKKDLYAVVGDLNDTPDSTAIAPLMGSPLVRDVMDVAQRSPDDRWTYYYGGNPKPKRMTQIDYVLVSPALAKLVKGVDIMRRGMTAVAEGKIPGITPYEEFAGFSTAASDHAAVVVDLDL